ncbi:hypothetical protein [Leuconostoc pseudomesenteroides]|uniref:hypothetical protein n=1 Tax=Leuconostoc pseudomesenteroides TaxID=33968 RepID=UPI00345F15DA
MKRLLYETIEIESDKNQVSNILMNGIQLLKTDPNIIGIEPIAANEFLILRHGAFNRQDMLLILEKQNSIEYKIDGQIIDYSIIWEFETLDSGITHLTQSLYIDETSRITPILSLCNTALSKFFSTFLENIKRLAEISTTP